MREIKIFGKKLIEWGKSEKSHIGIESQASKSKQQIPVILPPGRTSIPSSEQDLFIADTLDSVIKPLFNLSIIPHIRWLAYSNPDVSQAMNNLVELGNTGHTIKFDAAVTEEAINKMKAHLGAKDKSWSESSAGMNGLVNKMISQMAISGALSVEWVPNISLTGIQSMVMVNPEDIRWKYHRGKLKYEPYQYLKNRLLPNSEDNLVKLNPNTYRYYALNGDTDIPYGIPPYLASLESVRTQKVMMDNIKFIVEQIGVLGFLHVTMEKPSQNGGESYDAYVSRLEKFLEDTRKRVQMGYRDGITVGYKDDTDFDFKSATRDFAGVGELFQLNELLLSSGLKMDASMLGRNYGTSETQINVIFTKLLAQLKNIQNPIARCLEYGYALELRLAGFVFNTLTVIFNAPTALDELKAEQAREIKIRNENALYLDGIQGQEQYAHAMGFEKPNQKKPRFIRASVQTEAEAKQQTEKKKDASDKKVREKNKPREKPRR
jgi:hypothetical protein